MAGFSGFTFSFNSAFWLLSLVVLLPLVVSVAMRSLYQGGYARKLGAVAMRLALLVLLLASVAVLLLVRKGAPAPVGWWSAVGVVAGLLVLDIALLWWLTSGTREYAERAAFRGAVAAVPILMLALLVAIAVGGNLFNPWVLLLLAAMVLLTWLTARLRQATSIALRVVIVAMLIAAAAEMQLVRLNDRLTVMFLLDRSLSIPQEWRTRSVQYVQAAIKKDRPRDDSISVIAFAREPKVEIPPLDYEVNFPGVETTQQPENTDIAGVLKLAQAVFKEGTAKRIVLLSDGNENLGNALTEARKAAQSGIGIDVIPLQYRYENEVFVKKIATPASAQQGETVQVRVVLNSTHEASGTLHLFQRRRNREFPLGDPQRVQLQRGDNVLTTTLTITEPGSYDFQARFVPDKGTDEIEQNNLASDFTFVQGAARVLMIEQEEHQAEHDFLAQQLREENIEVDQIIARDLPFDLGFLQPYDSVILANVPKEDFNDDQIQMLATNTHEFGAGLVMLGGPDSFGAGGWRDTPVEKALPVDMEIKSAKVMPKGALVLIMHASEMAQGNYWQKVVARDAIRALSDHDYAGLLHWNGTDVWLWGGGLIPVGGNRNRMLARVNGMTPGDMPMFDPALVKARNALWAQQDASIKHIIVISDGDPGAPTNALVKSLQSTQPGRQISVSTVAVASHGVMDLRTMRNLATATGGKFYNPTNPRALPKIFQKEARRVSRPLIYEKAEGIAVEAGERSWQSGPLAGVTPTFPDVAGYVMTTPKESLLVQIPLLAAEPRGQVNALLAHWTYGLGKSAAFTSDFGPGPRWTSQWRTWSEYTKMVQQLIRWSMRSLDRGNFRVATVRQDDKVRIVVGALDKNDEFQNFLSISGFLVGPDMSNRTLKLEQTASGRYEGEFTVDQKAGSYFISLAYQGPDGVHGVLRTGESVPYSAEYREMSANRPLLEALAALSPKGGKPGQVIEGNSVNDWLEADIFRHDLPKATAAEDVWQWLVFVAAVLFFFDVLVRRVAVSFAWAMPAAVTVVNYVRARGAEVASVEYINRLRSRKEEVSRQLQRRQSVQRFEPEPDANIEPGLLEETTQARSTQPSRPAAARPSVAPEQEQEQEGYTSRLLKAKKRVWDERDNN